MKLRNIINKGAMVAMLAAMMGVTSCNYLDVVPPEQVSVDDAMKTANGVLGFLYSCYTPSLGTNETYDDVAGGNVGNENYNDVPYGSNLKDMNASADDMLNPDTWASDTKSASSRYYNYGTLSPNACLNFWHYWYSAIGQCYTFMDKLEAWKDYGLERKFFTESDYQEYKAECKALIAYYHYCLMKRYGPIVILEGKPDMNIAPADMPGRSHVDYVADWIVNQLDEAAPALPAYRDKDTRARMTSPICKALKAKVLLLVASPIYNGKFPYDNFRNVNYETPGYGLELVSHTYSEEKVRRAYQAADEAIKLAEGEGKRELYRGDRYETEADPQGIWDRLYIPGDVSDDFKKAVLRMKYLHYAMEGEGNHEFIFQTDSNGTQYSLWQSALPRNYLVLNSGQLASGYSGENPTLNMVLHFLTADGYLPENDPSWSKDQSEWYQTAGLSGGADEGRERIINLCVGREPRFYAWVGFDGGDFGVKIADGEPIHLNNIDPTKNGYDHTIRNNSISGFACQKFQPPLMQVAKTNNWTGTQWTARAIVRLAELYLCRAEAAAMLGNTTQAMADINALRDRACVGRLTADHLTKMDILEWVKNERMVEFAFEGKRLSDLIRWVEADKYLGAGKRMGLNANVESPTVEEFNKPTPIPYNYVWAKRMYTYPLPFSEVYSNPQCVQNPGY